MNEHNACNREEILIDYADGLLDDHKAAEVTAHLEHCPACREKLHALARSMELARTIWQDNLDQQPVSRSLAALILRRWPIAAAAAVLIFSLAVISHRRPTAAPPAPQLTAEQIEAQVMAEGSAAKLLAAAEILAKKPYAKDLAQAQYKYILDYYPETQAAARARTKTQ